MSEKVSRRDFLRVGGAVSVALTAAALGASCGNPATAERNSQGDRGAAPDDAAGGSSSGLDRRPATGEEAWDRLMEGNERYANFRPLYPDQGRDRLRRLADEDQAPFAVVIACSDSRVSPELIFDQGLGDLFVIRVVGNIVDQAVLGSIEYAVGELDVPLVLMLGHEECGGVTATVEGMEAEGQDLPGHILTFGDAIYPAVERARATDPGSQADLIDAAVRENARMGADRIRDDLGFLSSEDGDVKVLQAYYNLHDRRVSLL